MISNGTLRDGEGSARTEESSPLAALFDNFRSHLYYIHFMYLATGKPPPFHMSLIQSRVTSAIQPGRMTDKKKWPQHNLKHLLWICKAGCYWLTLLGLWLVFLSIINMWPIWLPLTVLSETVKESHLSHTENKHATFSSTPE